MRLLHTITIAWLFLTQYAVALGPEIGVAAALTDAKNLHAEGRIAEAYLTRYKDFGHFEADAKLLKDSFATHTFWNNARSRNGVFGRMRWVTPTLLAVRLDDYYWTIERWEQLGSVKAREPYYHWTAFPISKKTVPPYDNPTTKLYRQGNPTKGESAQTLYRIADNMPVRDNAVIAEWNRQLELEKEYYQKQQAATAVVGQINPKVDDKDKRLDPAFWSVAAGHEELCKLTKSCVPIVRGDWELNATSSDFNRDEFGYSKWFETGDLLKDFQALVGVDVHFIRKFGGNELADAVKRSGVAHNSRGIRRFPGIKGPYWLTVDFFTSIDRQNIYHLTEGYKGIEYDPPTGDASEQYGTLPNGLKAVALFDKNGKRQNSVPDTIAHNKHGILNVLRIDNGTDCFVCHRQAFQPFTPAIRVVRDPLGRTPPSLPKSIEAVKNQQIHRQLYGGDLRHILADDNLQFAAILKECNGLTPDDNADTLRALLERYRRDMTPEECASEIGMKLDAYLQMLVVSGLNRNNIFASQLHETDNTIRRDWWEEWFAVVQMAKLATAPIIGEDGFVLPEVKQKYGVPK